MLEDRLLVWRLKRGNKDALCRIYEKYRDDLLRLAASLSNEANVAEDIVHDVFVNFVRSVRYFQLNGSLKSYLATCVANRTRNANRVEHRHRTIGLDQIRSVVSNAMGPVQWIIYGEEFERLNDALAQIPYDQREVVVLHKQRGMKFKEIARLQNTSIKTALSRYRYGLNKLQSLLNSEVEK